MAGTWTCSEDEDFGSLGDFSVLVKGGTSGSPATPDDFVTADRAGEAVLKAATAGAKAMTLTRQIRPCELRALLISFVVASKAKGPIASISLGAGGSGYTALDVITVTESGAAGGTVTVDTVDGSGAVTGVTLLTSGTGYSVANGKATTGGTGAGCTIDVLTVTPDTDYIFITGTDAWDNAQTESIDVSAGNGTYTSTKRFRTITQIDCEDAGDGTGTAWADGTIRVTQPQWGLIWNLGEDQYRHDCMLYLGDGATTTYFTISGKQVTLAYPGKAGLYNIRQQRYSTLTVDRSQIHVVGVSNAEVNYTYLSTTSWIDSTFDIKSGVSGYFLISGSSVSIKRCIFEGMSGYGLRNAPASATLDSLIIANAGSALRDHLAPITNSTIKTVTNILYLAALTAGNTINITGVTAESNTYSGYHHSRDMRGVINYIDCTFDSWTISWTNNGNPSTTGYIYRKYSFCLEVAKPDGTLFNNEVTVTLKDKNGDTVFTGTTSSGVISKTGSDAIAYTRWHWASGAQVETTYNPFSLIVSAPGYQTLIMENITIDAPIDWHVELQPIDMPPKAQEHGYV